VVEESKLERADLYKDHLVQVFLSKFLSGEIEQLDPVFEPAVGYRYPLVEAILGESADAEAFLARLTDAGVLIKELSDKALLCPHCGSSRVATRYNCPLCDSFNVRKSALVEHIPCGYIDIEDHFRKGGQLVCPRCGKELKKSEMDYRKAGIWCTCSDCDKSFDIPVPSHFCRNCSKSFTFECARYENVYSYRLSRNAGKEASLGWILIAPIREFLETHGFKVETPGFLKGKSGANHMFDVTAYRKGTPNELSVIDLATSPQDLVTEQPVIAMFAKIYDVTPDRACLIAIPKISPNGRKMAKLYNITLIEAKNPKEAVRTLERVCIRAQ
jgi:transcription elongation factor Elf1